MSTHARRARALGGDRKVTFFFGPTNEGKKNARGAEGPGAALL
jgi:hypothetical protein